MTGKTPYQLPEDFEILFFNEYIADAGFPGVTTYIPVEQAPDGYARLLYGRVPVHTASTYYPGLCNHCTELVGVPECPADPVDMTFTNFKTGETTTMEVAATWKDPFEGMVQRTQGRGTWSEQQVLWQGKGYDLAL